jgi:integrase
LSPRPIASYTTIPIGHRFLGRYVTLRLRCGFGAHRSRCDYQNPACDFVPNDLGIDGIAVRSRLGQGIDGQPLREDMPFYQYAEEWYKLKKEPFVSDSSRSAYRSCFNKHLLPAFGLRHLRAISANELQGFINSFTDSSKSQITIAIGTLKALFVSAYAEGIIERDPSVSLIRPKAKKKTERRALTAQETENMLITMHRHEHGLYLAILYYLGLRRGEALGLQWGRL